MLAVREGAGAAGPPLPAGVRRQRVPCRWSGRRPARRRSGRCRGCLGRDDSATVVVRAPGTGATTSGARH